MLDGKTYFKIKYQKWHFIKCAWRHFMNKSNRMFQIKHSDFDKAISNIEETTKEIKDKVLARTLDSKKEIPVFRTTIPSHIPSSQHEDYVSTSVEREI
jgi:hypothetical protein